ncbi:MAG: 23S rRNA (adenine(2503)-C(2))-methyltransferase RlmN [Clostridia bacterium]|nr:23S rRNA (adenine(2503)-C(2))-methyltransferase RlmN [Clostridia bacterium]
MILLDLNKQQLQAYLQETLNVKRFVADQVFAWLNKGASFDQMTNVSLSTRQQLKQIAIDKPVKIVQTLTSKIDGTQKFLYQLHDGNVIEGVLMQYKYGNTLCVSTQVGCRMGCKFCASTIGGLVRNLTAGEILGQVVEVNALGKGERFVTNVVLMGSGEPLDNYDNVTKFLTLLSSPDGLNVSQRNVSLSTCGLVPQITQLADDGYSVNLTISLHSAKQENRQEIMPIANRYNLSQVMQASRYYFQQTGRRVIFEYTLIDGVNDTYSDALTLASLLRNMSAHVNLIRLNPVKETRLKSCGEANAKKFLSYLEKLKISATLRRQMGVDINGACGQLRRNYLETND